MIQRWDSQIEWSNDGTRRVINDFKCDDGRYVTYWDASVIEAERAKLQSERDALAAEVEGLRADAERYRWLRDALYRENVMVGEARVILRVTGVCPSTDEFDAAIDAARTAGGEGHE